MSSLSKQVLSTQESERENCIRKNRLIYSRLRLNCRTQDFV